MRVLILRPEPGASVTARAVTAVGCEPVVVPLFDIVPVAWACTASDFDAVAMTSANAARLGGAGLAGLTPLPLYAVGEATATAARAAGFGWVIASDGDARDLADALPPLLRVVHLCRAARRPITHSGVTEVPVYAAVARSIDAAALIARGDVALVHAASAGARLAVLAPEEARAALRVIAISARAAAACGSGWASIAVASRPREDAMLALLAPLCEGAA